MMKGWETLSLVERDAAFNNGLAVGFDKAAAYIAACEAASTTLRGQRPQKLGLRYAPGDRGCCDLFPSADANAPCLVFIFGGWWQRNSRETFSCMAEGVLARGWSAAFPDYTLAPGASLSQITLEIIAALDWLATEGPAHGIGGPLVLSGWSAGGHLAALHAGHPGVAAALPISGAFELGPLRDCPSINAKLQLSETEIETLSPLRLPPANTPMTLAYGTAELPRMVAASRDLHAHRAAAHQPGALLPIAGADHFTVLDSLRAPFGVLTRAAVDLAASISS